MQILSLLAVLLSVALFFPFSTDLCGPNCKDTVISSIMPYLGIFYFSMVTIFSYTKERWFRWFLPLGFGSHLGLYSYTVFAGYPCRICLLILLIHCTIFITYLWKHLDKNLRPVMAYTSVLASLVGFVLLSYMEMPNNSKLLNIAMANKSEVVEIGEAKKPPKKHKPEQSNGQPQLSDNPTDNTEQPKELIRIKPPVYLIYDLDIGNKVVDISEKPLVFWYIHCNHCEELLDKPSDKVQYVAVWLDDPEQDLPLAKKMANKHGVKSLYTIDIQKLDVESTPAIATWNSETQELEMEFGTAKVLEKISRL